MSLPSSAFFDTLRSQPDLPEDVWYLITATALCILNRPEDIPAVYTHAIGKGHGVGSDPNGVSSVTETEQLRIARRIREALIKTSAIGGMPKTINALQALKQAVPQSLWDEPPFGEDTTNGAAAASPTNRRHDIYHAPSSKILARGEAFFNKCYGKIAQRVMTSLDHSGTEDLGLAVRMTYGYVLSPVGVLGEMETSFVMIAGLIPQDVNPQLKGHLKGALNGGASTEQVRAVRKVAIRVCEAAGMRVLAADAAAAAPGGWRTEVQDL